MRGQVVLCPGVNDGLVFEQTMTGILDMYPELESVSVVPLGLSRYNQEVSMRLHTVDEARAMVAAIESWQQIFQRLLGHRMVFAADEYYLMADLPFPEADAYEGFHMHEDGIGMARTFEMEFHGQLAQPTGPQSGFFAAVDGAPANWLTPSLLAAGADLDVLRTTLPGKIVSGDQTRKRWKDIWTAGHGVGNIDDLPTTQALCQRLKQEYTQARLAFGQRLAGSGATG